MWSHRESVFLWPGVGSKGWSDSGHSQEHWKEMRTLNSSCIVCVSVWVFTVVCTQSCSFKKNKKNPFVLGNINVTLRIFVSDDLVIAGCYEFGEIRHMWHECWCPSRATSLQEHYFPLETIVLVDARLHVEQCVFLVSRLPNDHFSIMWNHYNEFQCPYWCCGLFSARPLTSLGMDYSYNRK